MNGNENTVRFFVPCLADAYDARATFCAARVLEHLGIEVVVPRGQTCCGQALHNAGLIADARPLTRRLAQVFSGDEPIVTTSASCAAYVRQHGPPEVAARTFELAAFLTARGFDPTTVVWPGRVAYHMSCHAKELGPDPVPVLLSGVTDLELVPLPRASTCCGFGGTFASTFPEVSVTLGEDKLRAATESDVTTLVLNDAGCRLHLTTLHAARTSRLEVKHLSEILAEGLHLVPRPPRPARPPAPARHAS